MKRKNLTWILGLAWKLSPARVVSQFVQASMGNIRWIFYSVVFIQYLVNSLAAHRPVQDILIFLGLAMLFFGIFDLFGRWFEAYYKPLTDNRMSAELSRQLFAKSASVDLSCYEDPAFYDRFTLAQKEAGQRLGLVLQHLPNAVVCTLGASFVIISLVSIDPVIPLFMGFTMVGNFIFGKFYNKANWQHDKAMETFNRRVNYVNRILYLPEYAKEIRLSGVRKVLDRKLEEGAQGTVDVSWKFLRRRAWWDFLRSLFSWIFPIQGAFLYGAWAAVVQKSISIGDYAVLASAVSSASWMIILLSRSLVELNKCSVYGENLRSFLEYQNTLAEKPGAPKPGAFASLELKSLGFSYPGSKEPALQNLDLCIKKGEKIAIVGHNGAGKTSLIKLLLRLYDPVEGQILYNGIPIQDLDLQGYRQVFSTAFQDYRLFALPVDQNVLLRPSRSPEDEARINRALDQAGVLGRVERMSKGRSTSLTREYDPQGEVLSGGEAQKIAIARAFAQDFQVAIFDEPSSALDPVAEYRLYQNMMEVCQDRTVIFISHRLSSATLADRIYLMEGGAIIESGHHSELMALEGKYARLFALQAENYLKDNYQTLQEAQA